MSVYFYSFILLLLTFPAFSQQISNVRATADSTTVTILYDLTAGIEGQRFTVDLYSSQNDYDTPLVLVSGEAGRDIQTGKDKKMVWETKELTNFDGQITFDVRAVLTFSPFVLKSPKKVSYKRGKSYQVEWAGGIPSEQTTLELYRNKQKVSSIAVTDNTGTHLWHVPAKLKAGGNYQLKVSSAQKPDNAIWSNSFRIRRKIPLVLKTVPVLAAGIVTYLLLEKDTPEGPVWLPEPDLPQ